ncbi:hypothetical protein [Paractinoplanes hotanensis]|uniref:Uncharacterized protein n=1 Tax=Paractinoplanes hotanensis TaxID=2906497 RepID=A0ABT0Y9M3_9ACTN|nr:hypothetical protein [Actinoplanes hotanensis]MCM4082172.1 hypothetical protein [Actinoplanes hotanensis]
MAESVQPARDPSLDTEFELGWRLGDQAVLLVGARHAVHVSPAGERRLLLPDADVQDPSRVRLRAVAARFGLPPSAGLVAAAAPEAVTEGALWADVEQLTWWSTRPAADSSVDPAAAAELPSIGEPSVDSSAVAGSPSAVGPSVDSSAVAGSPSMAGRSVGGEDEFADLLAELRAAHPFPVPPAVAAVSLTVVRWIDRQFHYRELWHDGDGGPMPAGSRPVEWAAAQHEPVAGGRAVATGQAGPVRIEVDGLHRSYLCRLSDGSRTAQLFVPGLPGATPRAEDQLAHRAEDPGRVLVRHSWRATSSRLDFSTPVRGTEVKRQVWKLPMILLAGGTGEPMVNALSGDAPREELRDVDVVADEQLLAALAALDRPLEPVALADCLEIEETWQSPHGSTSRAYLIAPGSPLNKPEGRTPLAPDAPLSIRLPSGEVLHRDVSVDSLGHFFDISRATGCPACGSVYGPCCREVARLFACTACDRPACAACRNGAEVPPARCARCGDESCGACSRALAVEPCRICERDMCRSCREDSVCLTCRSATPGSAGDVPEELGAHGLTVLTATDEGGTVVRLAGPHRREVVLLNGSAIVRWTSATDDPLLPLRIAAARLAGAGDVDVHALPEQHCPPAPRDWFTVDRTTGTTLHWAVMVGDTRAAGTFDPPPANDGGTPDSALRAELAAALPVERTPSPGGPAGEAVDAEPAAARLVACRMRTEDLVAVDARGLVHRTSSGPTTAETVAEWEAPEGTVWWAEADWNPQPEVVARTRLGEWEAVLARVGAHALLGLRHDAQDPAWHEVSAEPGDLTRALVGAALVAPGVTATVTALTTADDFTGITIAGASRMQRRLWYVGVVQPPQAESVPPARAQAAVAPGEPAAAPSATADLPEPLIAELSKRLAARPTRQAHVAIGLEVEEVWSLPDGPQLQITYEVTAGELEGHVPDAVTGDPLTEAYLCRSHHLAASVRTCATCLTSTCRACEDGVAPCPLCGGPVCRRCTATPDGRCRACASVAKISALSRSRYGAARGDAVWHGEAPNVQVTIRRLHDEWTLERQDHEGTVTFPLTEPALTHVRTLLP